MKLQLVPSIRNKSLLTASILSSLTLASLQAETNMDANVKTPEFTTSSTAEPDLPTTHSALPEKRAPETISLGAAIDSFKQHPTVENRSAVKIALAKLNLDIAEQEARMVQAEGPARTDAAAQIEALKNYRAAQLHRLPRNAVFASHAPHQHHLATLSHRERGERDERGPVEKMKDSALNAKDKVVSGAETAGSKVKSGAKTAAIKTKEGAETVAEKVEDGAIKAKRTVEKGAHKTGEAIKNATDRDK